MIQNYKYLPRLKKKLKHPNEQTRQTKYNYFKEKERYS